jgi:hypothetical protein
MPNTEDHLDWDVDSQDEDDGESESEEAAAIEEEWGSFADATSYSDLPWSEAFDLYSIEWPAGKELDSAAVLNAAKVIHQAPRNPAYICQCLPGYTTPVDDDSAAGVWDEFGVTSCAATPAPTNMPTNAPTIDYMCKCRDGFSMDPASGYTCVPDATDQQMQVLEASGFQSVGIVDLTTATLEAMVPSVQAALISGSSEGQAAAVAVNTAEKLSKKAMSAAAVSMAMGGEPTAGSGSGSGNVQAEAAADAYSVADAWKEAALEEAETVRVEAGSGSGSDSGLGQAIQMAIGGLESGASLTQAMDDAALNAGMMATVEGANQTTVAAVVASASNKVWLAAQNATQVAEDAAAVSGVVLDTAVLAATAVDAGQEAQVEAAQTAQVALSSAPATAQITPAQAAAVAVSEAVAVFVEGAAGGGSTEQAQVVLAKAAEGAALGAATAAAQAVVTNGGSEADVSKAAGNAATNVVSAAVTAAAAAAASGDGEATAVNVATGAAGAAQKVETVLAEAAATQIRQHNEEEAAAEAVEEEKEAEAEAEEAEAEDDATDAGDGASDGAGDGESAGSAALEADDGAVLAVSEGSDVQLAQARVPQAVQDTIDGEATAAIASGEAGLLGGGLLAEAGSYGEGSGHFDNAENLGGDGSGSDSTTSASGAAMGLPVVIIFAGKGSEHMYDQHTLPEVEQVIAYTLSQALDGCISAGLGGASLLGLTAADVAIHQSDVSIGADVVHVV